jgi:hypothetical protein
MLALVGEIKMKAGHGIHVLELMRPEPSKHEIAIAEDAFRDWMWKERGRLIVYR